MKQMPPARANGLQGLPQKDVVFLREKERQRSAVGEFACKFAWKRSLPRRRSLVRYGYAVIQEYENKENNL